MYLKGNNKIVKYKVVLVTPLFIFINKLFSESSFECRKGDKPTPIICIS